MNRHDSSTKHSSKNKRLTANWQAYSKLTGPKQHHLRQLLLNQPNIDLSMRFSPLGALYKNGTLSLLQAEAGQHYSKIAWRSLAFIQGPKLYQRSLPLPPTHRRTNETFTNPDSEREVLFEQKKQKTLKLYFHIQDVLEKESKEMLRLVDKICVNGVIPDEFETCLVMDSTKHSLSKSTQESINLLKKGLIMLTDIFMKP